MTKLQFSEDKLYGIGTILGQRNIMNAERKIISNIHMGFQKTIYIWNVENNNCTSDCSKIKRFVYSSTDFYDKFNIMYTGVIVTFVMEIE